MQRNSENRQLEHHKIALAERENNTVDSDDQVFEPEKSGMHQGVVMYAEGDEKVVRGGIEPTFAARG